MGQAVRRIRLGPYTIIVTRGAVPRLALRIAIGPGPAKALCPVVTLGASRAFDRPLRRRAWAQT